MRHVPALLLIMAFLNWPGPAAALVVPFEQDQSANKDLFATDQTNQDYLDPILQLLNENRNSEAMQAARLFILRPLPPVALFQNRLVKMGAVPAIAGWYGCARGQKVHEVLCAVMPLLWTLLHVRTPTLP